MILNKLASIDRYDIVVVSKRVAGEEIIKRVIGMPGDSIEIKEGSLFINDEEVIDIYGEGDTEDLKKVFLGPDEYWVMGDNRTVSLDSRFFGKIKKKDIKGETQFIIYPFNRFGKIK
jgi:signal peptidase I